MSDTDSRCDDDPVSAAPRGVHERDSTTEPESDDKSDAMDRADTANGESPGPAD